MRTRVWAAILIGWGLVGPVCGSMGMGRAEVAPTLQMDDQPRQFIAPGNAAAQARVLTLPFSRVTFTARGEVIKSWTFTVYNSSGQKVSSESRVETRDRGFFGELFNIGPRPQVDIPQELTWDGAYHRPGQPEDGQLVPDGNYTYQISILDSAGGHTQTPPFNVTVKNSPVTVSFVRFSTTVFSPLGARKTVTVEQAGSREYRWVGRFLDASGRPVWTKTWSNPADNQNLDLSPPTFAWDGRDDLGQVVPDGLYHYELRGTNRAGANTLWSAPTTVEVSERAGSVQLAATVPRFSPLAVGQPRTLGLVPSLGSTEGVVRWTIRVTDATHPDQVRWVRRGTPPLPDKIEFAGQTSDGLDLPEGTYQATFSASYDNGNSTESSPVTFDILRRAPRAQVSASAAVFGGSGRAGVTLEFTGDPGPSWTLTVANRQSAVVRTYSLGSTGTGSVEFQGLDEAGKALPDGSYAITVTGTNEVGIPGAAQTSVTKDSRPMPLALEVSSPVLVPGQGAAGSLRITPHYTVFDSVTASDLTVTGPDGALVWKRHADTISTFWDWSGLTETGVRVGDGDYQAQVKVAYANGSVSQASAPFRVDSHFLDNAQPQARLTLSSKIFSPVNVDGPATLKIALSAQPGAASLASWSLQIQDPRGKLFRTFQGTGSPPAEVVWDGRSDSRDFVESGEQYGVVFQVSDQNHRTAEAHDGVTADILVDKLPDGRYRIVISAIQFAGYSSDVFKVGEPLLTKNLFVLRRLADVLNRLPDYQIALEGYAVSEYSTVPASAQREQTNELIPLSRDRAAEVRTALVLLGVQSGRFTVQGFGAQRPVVPDTDLENRWKNRRVEFYLEKNR